VDPLHLPLKVDDRGHLIRCDRKQLLIQLLRVMALTHAKTWAPDPEFGLRQYFEPEQIGQTPRTNLLQSEIDTLNNTLERLGMSDFRVTAVERIPDSKFGESSYVITISSSRGPEILELKV
jgi:hypothetical protein